MQTYASLNDEICAPENPGSTEKSESYHSLRTIDTRTPGMHVLTEALVTKLIVEKDGNVTEIEFAHTGKCLKGPVTKEVILSAGTVKSPQIFELSGIGNPEVLSKAGVHCIVDNARLGEDLRDHPVAATGLELVGKGPQSVR